MSMRAIDATLATLEFSRGATLGFLEDIPEDKWCHQPIPGANHAAWIAGHIASTDNYFLTSLAGQASSVPAEWDDLFGMGSTPKNDPSVYPSPAELRDQLQTRRDGLTAWLKSLSDAQLAKPLEGDLARFAPNYAALAGSIAWHEGMHAGQLTLVRKSLGIGPKFG